MTLVTSHPVHGSSRKEVAAMLVLLTVVIVFFVLLPGLAVLGLWRAGHP